MIIIEALDDKQDARPKARSLGRDEIVLDSVVLDLVVSDSQDDGPA